MSALSEIRLTLARIIELWETSPIKKDSRFAEFNEYVYYYRRLFGRNMIGQVTVDVLTNRVIPRASELLINLNNAVAMIGIDEPMLRSGGRKVASLLKTPFSDFVKALHRHKEYLVANPPSKVTAVVTTVAGKAVETVSTMTGSATGAAGSAVGAIRRTVMPTTTTETVTVEEEVSVAPKPPARKPRMGILSCCTAMGDAE